MKTCRPQKQISPFPSASGFTILVSQPGITFPQLYTGDTHTHSCTPINAHTHTHTHARIGKARTAFNILNKIWKSKNISLKTKLQIFNSNIKTVLLYGSETWRTTTNISNKLQTFINHCLRRILGVFWPNTISNINLWECTKQETVDIQLLRRKWSWIGHTLRRNTTAITKQALDWTETAGEVGMP